jgi:hypothetical protein
MIEYYVELDEENNLYCVFDQLGFAHASYCDLEEAKRMAIEMNEAINYE